MSDGRFAILDPAAGISGDMLLGALVAAGASPDWLLGVPQRLGLPDVRIAIEPVDRCGLRATKVNVQLADGSHEEPSQLIHAPHSHPPTGAALLRVLSSGPPPVRWRVVGAGAWGAGGRDPEEYPNALRLILAEPAPEAGDVVVLSTDIDDLSPEYLEPLRAALVEAGALDVQMWATQMKKGRIGFRVETVVPPGEADRVSEALVRHSTTAGVRRQTVERFTLPRREVEVEIGDGINVRVKVLDAPDGPRVKPEFDDVAAVARRTGRPVHEVARDLHQRALRLVDPDGATQVVTSNKES
jgi:uncharacterized protein (DUF111 family)